MLHELNAREYKLLLDPARFSDDPAGSVDIFWNDQMKRLIDLELGPRNGRERRHDG